MKNLIRVCDVEKYYGRGSNVIKAVDRVSFQVDSGEFLGIMGPSGSGKTTLLNILSTIDCVTSGHVFFDNRDITTLKDAELAAFRRENLGFVFQDFNLLDTLTIRENIILALTLRGESGSRAKAAAQQVMQKLNILETADQFPWQVSGGQKQRCACARALVTNPRLILADEPTGALDSKASGILMETFGKLNDEFATTILMVTHDAFCASFCRRILFLQDGKLFLELYRGEKDRRTFFNEILDVLAMTGGEFSNAD